MYLLKLGHNMGCGVFFAGRFDGGDLLHQIKFPVDWPARAIKKMIGFFNLLTQLTMVRCLRESRCISVGW